MAAACFGYAKKHGMEFSVPAKTHNQIWSPIYFPHLINPSYDQGREDVLINELWNTDQQYQEIEFQESWRIKQVILNGYWQSYKYFDFCKKELFDAFQLRWELNKGVAALHVRRGDYLLYPTKHPVVTLEYLLKAIEILRDKKGIKKFIFFSDDIPWCITSGVHLHFKDCEFEYSTNNNEIIDLIAMSCCEHIAISNSTLSWWGAELNQNPGKVVIAPDEENWFGPDNKHLTVKDLLRPEWLRIKYEYVQQDSI
jgi:hypothetical protein